MAFSTHFTTESYKSKSADFWANSKCIGNFLGNFISEAKNDPLFDVFAVWGNDSTPVICLILDCTAFYEMRLSFAKRVRAKPLITNIFFSSLTHAYENDRFFLKRVALRLAPLQKCAFLYLINH